MKNRIFQIVLIVVIVVLAYFTIESPLKDIRFDREKNARAAEVIQKLKDIRELQKYFKTNSGRYTGSFDTLIAFAEKGEIPVVKIIPDPTDTTFTRSISDTIAYVKIYDSLFKNRENFNIEKLSVIPFSGGEHFVMESGTIDKGGVKVPVFQAYAMWAQIMKGQDDQLILNMNSKLEHINKFQGLKVGSIDEVSLDGNWE